jgi:hypothetical protein
MENPSPAAVQLLSPPLVKNGLKTMRDAYSGVIINTRDSPFRNLAVASPSSNFELVGLLRFAVGRLFGSHFSLARLLVDDHDLKQTKTKRMSAFYISLS